MPDIDKTDPSIPRPHKPARRRAAFGAALIAACAVGAGATALARHGAAPIMVALPPAPIAQMTDGSPVAVQGEVAEVFGNKFILADASGRTLVETGRTGERRSLVAKQDAVTVQGRFEHGFIHAAALRFGDGRVVMLDFPDHPPPPPPRGPLS